MFKKLILIFGMALGLNLLWEFAHHGLYLHYRGEVITDLILIRAAVVDGLMISGLWSISLVFKKYQPWVIVLGGLMLATGLEFWALATGRWAYGPLMPLVPWLGVGLTPFIQLALTGYLANRATRITSLVGLVNLFYNTNRSKTSFH